MEAAGVLRGGEEGKFDAGGQTEDDGASDFDYALALAVDIVLLPAALKTRNVGNVSRRA